MKSILKSVTAGTALCVTASAAYADGPFSLKDTVPVVEAPTWTGVYFGAGMGYGHNSSKNNYYDSDGARSSKSEHADGGLVSLLYGYDRQVCDRFVVGVFGDIDLSDITRGSSDDHNALQIDRGWSVGGRAGFLLNDRTLLFATAGYTQAHFQNDGWWDIDNGSSILHGAHSKTFGGYFVGGGLESRLTDNFYLRGEVRYSDYSRKVTNAGSFAGTDYVDAEVPSLITGRVSLVYKLGRSEIANPGSEIDDTQGPKYITYAGVDGANHAWAFYSGALAKINGGFYTNGFILRSEGIVADYDYIATGGPFTPDPAASAPAGTRIDARDRSLDVMLGYQWVQNDWSATAYIGYEVRDVHLSPNDMNNDVRGTDSGLKVAFELETDDESDKPFYGAFETSYSMAFDSYWAQGRLGYNFQKMLGADSVIFGPEVSVLDDDGDLATRVGAFTTLRYQLTPKIPMRVTFDIGNQFVNDNGESRSGGEGLYGGGMVRFDY
ncbi:MAG TPA: cellulose biosynthesis protein BcsS [Hyphomicrobium sp.]|jgi:opacity protein-like surface antigen|nr:cellulose biosynthesis protein BcsS [Hyphomicrobium sp.]